MPPPRPTLLGLRMRRSESRELAEHDCSSLCLITTGGACNETLLACPPDEHRACGGPLGSPVLCLGKHERDLGSARLSVLVQLSSLRRSAETLAFREKEQRGLNGQCRAWLQRESRAGPASLALAFGVRFGWGCSGDALGPDLGPVGAVGSNPTPPLGSQLSALKRHFGLAAGRVTGPQGGPTRASRTPDSRGFFPRVSRRAPRVVRGVARYGPRSAGGGGTPGFAVVRSGARPGPTPRGAIEAPPQAARRPHTAPCPGRAARLDWAPRHQRGQPVRAQGVGVCFTSRSASSPLLSAVRSA